MKKKTLVSIFSFILSLLIISHFSLRIFQYRERYLEKFDPQYWEQRYLNSQWIKAIDPEPIGDDGVYTWAGWRYFHGENPILINPEMPPLGKYLLGLTIQLTNNRNLFAVWTGILSLISLFLLAKKTLKSSILGLAVIFLFSLEPLFYQQLRAPFLDTLYLSFFSLFLFFAFGNWWLSFLFLGAAASTKATLVTLGLGLTTIFLTIDDWRLTWPIITLAVFLFWLKFFKKKRKVDRRELPLGIYCLIYLGFLSFVPVWPRYLLLFLPFGLILLVGLVKKNLFAKIKLK